MATVVILLDTAGGGTWTVPLDWNNANNFIECIGGGGTGVTKGQGGAGGSYAKISNITLTPGATTYIQVGDPASSGVGSSSVG